MKRIAVITSHIVQYQIPLFQKFKKYGIKADVFFASNHGFNSKKKDDEFQTKFNWDTYKKPFTGFKYYFPEKQKFSISDFRLSFENLGNILKQKQYDGILILGWNKILYLKAIFLASKLGIKKILRVETNLNSNISYFKKIFKFFGLRIFFKLFDSFLYIGTLNKLFYKKLGVPNRKLFNAPYFVDNDFFTKGRTNKKFLKKKLNLENKKIIIFVGKLIDRKNPFDFLKLAKKFKKKKKLHFILVGNGYLKDKCKKFTKENNLSNVTHMGFQNQKNLRNLYKISDLLILPSEYETWGLVINEAMASNVPVIATTRCGASKDLIRNGFTGFTYNPGNLEKLYLIFDNVISDKNRLNSIKKKAKLKVDNFTYSQTLKSIHKILSKKI